MVATSLLICHLGFEPPQRLAATLFPRSWHPLLHCGLLGLAWDAIRVVVENQSTTQFQSSLSTPSRLLPVQASICILLRSRVQPSHSPPASPTGPLTSQGGLSSFCWIPGLEHPKCGLNHSLSGESLHPRNLPFLLSHLPEHLSLPDHFSSLAT